MANPSSLSHEDRQDFKERRKDYVLRYAEDMVDPKCLFNNSHHSDVIVEFGAQKFYGHKAILCSRCSFFEKALSGVFMEKEKDVFELHDDNEDAVWAMLHYIHGQPHSALLPMEPSDKSMSVAKTKSHLYAYAIADKYGLDPMKSMVLQELSAYVFGCGRKLEGGFAALAGIVETVYAITPENDHGLRDLLLWYVSYYQTFTNAEYNIERDALRIIYESCPDFAADVSLRLGQKVAKLDQEATSARLSGKRRRGA